MRSRVRAISLHLASLTLAATAAHAGPLTGRVVDPDGRGVPGAQVILLTGGSVLRSTHSDPHGGFTLTAPDAGPLELRVAVDGFRAAVRALDGSPQPTAVGDVALGISAVSESLIVSAAQVEIPLSQASSAVTIITGAELEARQVTTVADALRQVPGLTIARSGGPGALTAAFPRGGESDYTLVFLDGIQLNAFGGGFDFAHLSTANIDRIEVVRGPQSALYGSNAIGAVVRIVTRTGGPVRGGAAIEGGSFGTSRVSAASSGAAGRWFWGAGADRIASDGFDGRRTADGEVVANDRYERTESAGSGGWRNDAGAMLRGELRFARDDRGFPGPFGSNPAGIFTGIDSTSRGTDDRWSASLGGAVPAGRRVRAAGQVTWNTIDGHFAAASAYSPGGVSLSQSGSRRLSARGQADIVIARGFDASAGVELQRERVTSTYITASSGAIPIERSVAGYFGEARWSRADRLFVTGGIRLEDIRRDAVPALDDPYSPRPAMAADSVTSVNPRIAASYTLRRTPGADTRVRASAGTGIRPPDGFDIAYTDNPSLKPERTRSVEAGVEQSLASGRAVVEATYFRNTFDDLIVAVGRFAQSSRYRTDNISNARARGMELAATTRERAGGVDLQARLTYTFLDSAILAVDRAGAAPPPFEPGQRLLQRPRHQWAVDLSAAQGRWTTWVRGGGRGRVLAVEPSYGTFGGLFDAAGYAAWNAGGSVRLTKQLEAFARVENLLGRSYEEVFGFPALPRGVFAGLRVAAGR
ncbi:MAG: TonB-dependent receptor [Acidobacteriota bacterium]